MTQGWVLLVTHVGTALPSWKAFLVHVTYGCIPRNEVFEDYFDKVLRKSYQSHMKGYSMLY